MAVVATRASSSASSARPRSAAGTPASSSLTRAARGARGAARPRGDAWPSDQWTDDQLGAACAGGAETRQEAAWAILYRRMTVVLAGHARALRNDPDLIDDLVQETLVRAWEHRASYDPQYSYLGWLKTILHRGFTSFLRKEAVRDRTAEAGEETGGGIGVWHGSAPGDLLDHALTEDLRSRLQPILEGLKPEEREVLLVWAAGGSLEEFAAERREKSATIRSHLFRAKKRMVAAFQAEYGDVSPDAF